MGTTLGFLGMRHEYLCWAAHASSLFWNRKHRHEILLGCGSVHQPTLCHAKKAECGPGRERKEHHGRALVQDTRMVRIDTKFLRLREPVLWGQEIDGWHVCWLGGWDKCRMFYIVMVVNRPASTKKKVKPS